MSTGIEAGRPAPEFELEDQRGAKVALKDLREAYGAWVEKRPDELSA